MTDIATETAPADAPPAIDSPSRVLALAIQRMHKAQMEGQAEAATTALQDAMDAFCIVTASKYEDGLPRFGEDYAFTESAQGISIQSLTAKGEMLCALWDSYTTDLEKQALQTRVMQLSHLAQKHEDQLQAMQRQLDNCMLDLNKIRRTVKV